MSPVDGDLAVLCVDDELSVLAGLSRQLRRHFRTSIAGSGPEALDLIRNAAEPYAVIVSDMRMPGMNGAEFLKRSRELSPQSVRILLTGHADAESAAMAVNEGGISHFLTKPCSGEKLMDTLLESADTYRRLAVERDVLERTVRGSIDALAQTLALAAPAVFARAGRASATVSKLVAALDPPDGWAVEVAVPLSQLGAVTLPHDVLERWYSNNAPTAADEALIAQIPELSLSIVEQIPRLEVVCEIIRAAHVADAAGAHPGGGILRVALDVDTLEARGVTRSVAVDRLRARLGDAFRNALDTLIDVAPPVVVACRIHELRVGMSVARDLTTADGVLLVGRGTPVSEALIARLRNFSSTGTVPATIWVEERS